MRTRIFASALAVAGVALTGLAAPAAAHAAEFARGPGVLARDGWVWKATVSPSTVTAGGQVTVGATPCIDGASAESPAFGKLPLTVRDDVVQGVATVRPDTKPGTYRVRIACENGEVGEKTLTLTVTAPASPAAAPSPSPAADLASTLPTPLKPMGAVEAGGVGSIEPTRSGSLAYAGLAAVPLAAGAGLLLLRRRRSSRR